MTNITILATLEYLGRYGDINDKDDYVGLTLQVASDANAVEQTDKLLQPWTELLRPWAWTGPTSSVTDKRPRIRLLHIPDGDTSATVVELSANPPKPVAAAPISLREKLDTQFRNLCNSGLPNKSLGWTDSQNPEGASSPLKSTTPAPLNIYRWPAQLAQMGRYAYPIAHQLNLSYFVKAKDSLQATFASGGSLVAAPAFTANGISYEPQLMGITMTGDIASIPYSATPASDYAVVVQVQSLPIAKCSLNNRTTRTPPIVSGDPYVALPPPEDTAWQHHLIPLAAELFDPSARLIGAFRQVVPDLNSAHSPASNQLLTALTKDLEPFCSCVVYALQSVADCGGQRAPGNLKNKTAQQGPSLITRILKVWIAAQTDATKTSALAFQDNLLAVLDNYPRLTPADWSGLLQLVPALAGNPVVTPPKNPPTTSITAEMLFARLAALENLHLALTQNEVLRSIIVLQWKKFYATSKTALVQTDPNGKLWESFRDAADDQLTKVDLRQQLAAGNLGSNWNTVLSEMDKALASNPPPTSRAALRTGLSNALCRQLNNLLGAPPNLVAFDPTSLLTCLFGKTSCDSTAAGPSWVDAQLTRIVPEAPLPDANQKIPRQRTRTSEGITLTLDDLSGQNSTADAADSLRSMAGICVLARLSGAPSWKCLNLSVACLDREGKVVLTPQGTVVPIPMHNQAGLRSTMITYNNRPLMGLSPEMKLGDPFTTQPAVAPNTNLPIGVRLIEYLHPSLLLPAQTAADRKLPGLIFGNSYDFLIGIMRSSSALPASFAASDEPGMLDLTRQISKIEDAFKSHGLQKIAYLRTVPIGELRFGKDLSGFNQGLELPVIPPGVQPRALDTQANDDQRKVTQPLILLTDFSTPQGVASVSFNVFKPSIDIRTWDAWVAADGMSAQTRAAIWAYFHAQANLQAVNGAKADLSLDEPAVRQLDIKLDWLDGTPGSHFFVDWPVTTLAAPTSPDPYLPSLDQASWEIIRSGPVPVTIQVSTSSSPGLYPDGTSGAKVIIPPGSLARLTLTPALRRAECDKRFASGILSDTTAGVPYSFFLESADTGKDSPSLPSAAELRSAVSLACTSEKLTFTLNLDPVTQSKKFRNVRSAKLRLQTWRWDGRAGSPFPFASADKIKDPIPPTDLITWEAETFTLRSANDSSQRALSLDIDGRSLSVSEDISSDRGVLYFRYGVTAFSRYGPLVPPDQQSIDSLGSLTAQTHWKRFIAPLRWQGPIPKPAVKLVLPLTSSLQTDDKAASLLVVVQGPWYAIGGLAEHMKAELLYVGSATQKRWAEAGPDPIRWTGTPETLASATYSFEGDADAPFADPDGYRPKLTTLKGPVGHTFDDTDVNPLFVNCSFVLPPIKSNPETDTSWDFAKVRFRRIFDPGAPGVPASASGQSLRNALDISSEPTDAYWVQFLPNNDHLHSTDALLASMATLTSEQSEEGWTFTIRNRCDANSQPIEFSAPTQGAATVQHFLLLTKRVQESSRPRRSRTIRRHHPAIERL